MQRIGQYEVTAGFVSASAGGVCQARDTVSDRDVALKLFRPAPGADVEVRARWMREALACSELRHPNIAPVLEAGEADGWLYIAREWLHGVDLEQFIRQSRVAPLVEKIEMMAQVLDALEHAHRNGVLHRDVKPSNIFLCHGQTLRVLDFGLSRLPSSRLALASRTPGTPNYFAPELILRRPCDSRSDIFSAGVVFVELLINAHPFQHPFIPKRILESLPESPRIRNSEVPKELERLLMRALEKDPERRIQTADELGSELREIARYLRTGQTGSPVSGLVVSAVQAQKAFPREPRVPAGAAVNQATIDDPADRRVGDLISLMNEFEDSLARWDLEAGGKLIDRMSALETLDGRFELAIADCQQRLDEIRDAPRPISQAHAAVATSSNPPEPARTRPMPAAPRPATSRFVTPSAAPPVASAAPPPRPAFQTGASAQPAAVQRTAVPSNPVPAAQPPAPVRPTASVRPSPLAQQPTPATQQPIPAVPQSTPTARQPSTAQPAVPTTRQPTFAAQPQTPASPQPTPAGEQLAPAAPAAAQQPAPGSQRSAVVLASAPAVQASPAQPIARLPWLTPLAQPTAAPPSRPGLKPTLEPSPPSSAIPAEDQSPAAPQPDTPLPGAPPPKRSYAWLAAGSLAGLVCIVVLFAIIRSLFAPAEIFSTRPFVATAVVAAESTNLYEREDASSRRIASLRRGEAFHILSLPRGRGQEWIPAQVAGKQALSEPGYVRAADLEQWSSLQPGNLLALLSSYSPGDRAPLPELTAYSDRVRSILVRYPQFPDAPRASLELARAELAIARAGRLSGRPDEEWRAHLARAREAVGSAADPETRAMRRQLDEMAAFLHGVRIPEAASPPDPPARRSPNPAELLSRASAAWSNGDYRSAMRSVDRLLAANPKNAEALQLKVKIQRAQEAEAKLTR